MSTLRATSPRRPAGSMLSNRPLAVQIGSAVAALALAACAVGTFSLVQLSSQSAQQLTYADNIIPLTQLAQLEAALGDMRSSVLTYYIWAPSERPALAKIIDQRIADISSIVPSLRLHATNVGALDAAVSAATDHHATAAGDVLPLIDAGRTAQAKALIASKPNPLAATATSSFAQERSAQRTQVDDRDTRSRADNASARVIVIASIVAGLAVGLGLAVAVVRSIRSTVRRVQGSMSALADGDLTVQSGVTSRDELGQMAGSLAHAQGALRSLMSKVSESASAAELVAKRGHGRGGGGADGGLDPGDRGQYVGGGRGGAAGGGGGGDDDRRDRGVGQGVGGDRQRGHADHLDR